MDEAQKKYVRIGIIAAVLLVVVAATVMIVQNRRMASMGKLTTVVVPDDAIMTIDNKNVKINKKIGVTPGEHTIKVKRSGFKPQEKKFRIKLTDNIEIRFFLEPSSPEGFNWITNHPEQAHIAESYASQEFDRIAEEATKKNPVIKELPYIDQFFRVDYGVSEKNPKDSTARAIYIRYWNDQGKVDALGWLRFKGYDPDKLEIIYIYMPSTF